MANPSPRVESGDCRVRRDPCWAEVPPVPEGVARPRWSVMIPVYNCAALLRETLSGVLAQDPGAAAMQIEVVDDASTRDDPRAVVEELGGGRVGFYRQPQNLGHVGNFNTCLSRARGELVHLLHGDDHVLPGFYRRMERAFDASPEAGMAFCRHLYMDERGRWDAVSGREVEEAGVVPDWLGRIARGQRIVTPSVVVRRSVYERLGGFDRRFRCAGEDWEMWVRIACCYPVWADDQTLAAYRMKRPGALTEAALGSKRIVRDMITACEVIESYLPGVVGEREARRLLSGAREMYAYWALDAARSGFAEGGLPLLREQLGETFRCSRSLRTVGMASRLMGAWGWRAVRRRVAKAVGLGGKGASA